MNQENMFKDNTRAAAPKGLLRRAAPYAAAILISAVVGGASGAVFMGFTAGNNTPAAPVSTGGDNSASPVVYTESSNLISKIAAEAGPSVVGIETSVVAQSLFGQQSGQSSGSGIIFDKAGYIITNQHVINGGGSIYVTLPGGKKLQAKVIGQDTMSDIAVLKVDADNLPAAKLGDSSKVRVGDLAVAIGNPMGEEYAGSVTSGIISALNRTMNINDDGYSRRYKLIQTDAAINPGNSGGPLINKDGEVIGVNSIKFTDTNVEGMGFAIPVNDVKSVVDQLMKSGYVSRPYLGVSVSTVTDQMASQGSYPQGAIIGSVEQGSSAGQAGLRLGDVIVEVDGVKVSSSDELINELMKHKAGDTVNLKIWRNGLDLSTSVKLGERESTAS
jgi:serine protease Do